MVKIKPHHVHLICNAKYHDTDFARSELINLFSEQQLMLLALFAYAAYFVNAIQFLIKLRAARIQSAWEDAYVQ